MLREIPAIVMLFLIAQLLGLFVGISLINQARIYPELEALDVSPAGGAAAESSFAFLAYVILGAAALLLVLKFYRGVLLYKLLEAAVIFAASNVVFYVALLALNVPGYLELSFIMSLGLAAAKFVWSSTKNAAAVIASAGVGAIFGFSLDVVPALIFMACLAIYDVLAVFWTKHMIVMAQELGRRNLAFSVRVEGREMVRVERKAGKEGAKGKAEGRAPGARPAPEYVERKTYLELGTGDMAIPLMLAVSSYKMGGLVAPIAVVLASTLALYTVLWYVMEKKTFLPALPPLCAAGTLALGLVKLAEAVIAA